ncbi:MAG: esterase family protein [Clostridia bacterium]|nr:esterase family protein [Clostridia bacterium]
MAFVDFKYFSPVMGMQMNIGVILPEVMQGIGVEGTGKDENAPIPTLYLLHGTSDDQTIWHRRTSIERYVSDKRLAVVMMTTHLGAYTNQKYGFRYFDYVAKEVPEICARYFNLSRKREEKFIAGLSMGGYGALKIGLALPDEFSVVGGLSAGVDRLGHLPEALRTMKSIEEFRAMKDELDPRAYANWMNFFLNFGSPAEFAESKENNLFLLAEEAKASGKTLPKLIIRCGTEDKLAIEPNRRFKKHLDTLGIENDYAEFPGIHSWEFWDTHIQYVLSQIEL